MIASTHKNWWLPGSFAVAICLFGTLAPTPTASTAQVKSSSKVSHDPNDEPFYWKIGGPDSKGNRVGDLKGKTPIDVLVGFRDRKPDSTNEEKVDGKPVTKLSFKNATIGDRTVMALNPGS